MQENKGHTSDLERRRIRVNRIKKSIRWAKAFLLVFPVVFSIFLFVQVLSLSQNVELLEEKINRIFLENHTSEESIEEDLIEESLVEGEENLSETLIEEENLQEDLPSNIVTKEIISVEDIIPSTTKKVYLTFDDGPSLNTANILDILAEYDVKATFFVVGREEEEYLDLYKRIVDEGHTIGVHSYSHVYSEIYASAESFLEDLEKNSDYVYELTGVRPFCYRFPGGSSTTKMHGDFDLFKECVLASNLIYFDWNASAQDSGEVAPGKEEIVDNVTRDLGYYDTTIILFHDAFEKKATVEALPEIIEYIQAMPNTVILPISEGTELIQQK